MQPILHLEDDNDNRYICKFISHDLYDKSAICNIDIVCAKYFPFQCRQLYYYDEINDTYWTYIIGQIFNTINYSITCKLYPLLEEEENKQIYAHMVKSPLKDKENIYWSIYSPIILNSINDCDICKIMDDNNKFVYVILKKDYFQNNLYTLHIPTKKEYAFFKHKEFCKIINIVPNDFSESKFGKYLFKTWCHSLNFKKNSTKNHETIKPSIFIEDEIEEQPSIFVEDEDKIEENPSIFVEDEDEAKIEENPSIFVEDEDEAKIEEQPSINVEDEDEAKIEEQPSINVEDEDEAKIEEQPSINVEDEDEAKIEENPSINKRSYKDVLNISLKSNASKEESLVIDSKEEHLVIDSKEESLVTDSKEESLVIDSKEESLVIDSKEESLVIDSKEESLVIDSKEESLLPYIISKKNKNNSKNKNNKKKVKQLNKTIVNNMFLNLFDNFDIFYEKYIHKKIISSNNLYRIYSSILSNFNEDIFKKDMNTITHIICTILNKRYPELIKVELLESNETDKKIIDVENSNIKENHEIVKNIIGKESNISAITSIVDNTLKNPDDIHTDKLVLLPFIKEFKNIFGNTFKELCPIKKKLLIDYFALTNIRQLLIMIPTILFQNNNDIVKQEGFVREEKVTIFHMSYAFDMFKHYILTILFKINDEKEIYNKEYNFEKVLIKILYQYFSPFIIHGELKTILLIKNNMYDNYIYIIQCHLQYLFPNFKLGEKPNYERLNTISLKSNQFILKFRLLVSHLLESLSDDMYYIASGYMSGFLKRFLYMDQIGCVYPQLEKNTPVMHSTFEKNVRDEFNEIINSLHSKLKKI